MPYVAVDCCFLLSLTGAVELFSADTVFVLSIPVELPKAWLFHGLKSFCNGFESYRKLLLIFFFCFSIDFAAANSLRRLLCLFANNT